MLDTKRRGLAEEVEKHFRGTPASRLLAARRLGRRSLALFRAGLHEGTSLAEARRQLEIAKKQGRRRSAVIEALYK